MMLVVNVITMIVGVRDFFMKMMMNMPSKDSPALFTVKMSVVIITVMMPVKMALHFVGVFMSVILSVQDNNGQNHQNGTANL